MTQSKENKKTNYVEEKAAALKSLSFYQYSNLSTYRIYQYNFKLTSVKIIVQQMEAQSSLGKDVRRECKKS